MTLRKLLISNELYMLKTSLKIVANKLEMFGSGFHVTKWRANFTNVIFRIFFQYLTICLKQKKNRLADKKNKRRANT